ncbi:MAG TPA: cohesin domain-containing protein [Candidatus Paceibacterota bacterium]|jgi:hypothetical protein|nr:cohesin domain-containing protein [Candidatus Paceibacterota bacterium]
MKHLTKILLISTLLFILYTGKAFAADIAVSMPTAAVVGGTFEVLISVDSDGTPINSADITLHYDQNMISFSGYKSDGGVMGIWIEVPHEKNGNIYMSGIIPGGASGLYDPKNLQQGGLSAIPLVRLLFTAKASGAAPFSFIKTQILRNDGLGTELPHGEQGGEIKINNAITGNEAMSDKEKPEPFEVTFVPSSNLGETPSMIIFSAYDTGSGIKEYKINRGGSVWMDVQSPYPVSRGILPKTITIRAFDFYGNYTDSSIAISGLLPFAYLLALAIVVLAIFCILIYKMLKYRK